MAVQALYGVLNLFFNLLIACRPLAAAWDLNLQLSGAVELEEECNWGESQEEIGGDVDGGAYVRYSSLDIV